MIVFDKLNNWIKANDISYKEFAEQVGVHYTNLLLVLNRKATFRLNVVDKICEVTGLSIEQLITWYPDDTYDMAKAYKKNSVSYEKLFALMQEKGYSDYALSKALGRSVNYIGTVKRLGGKISIDVIKKIAEILKVKPSDLFEIKGE